MSESEFIIYNTDDGRVRIEVRIEDETVWITQAQMAELFGRDKRTVSEHIRNIFSEGELDENSVVRKYRTTAADGKTYQVEHYNLDVIISVGYRVKSLRGTQFRQWATKRLNEYIRKGFTLDDERLKGDGGRYFRELLQRIHDIRASERNFYQQVTDIYSTAVDYDPKAETTREFFATVQNKLHFAAHKHTAAEIVYERVDSRKPMVGMTNFKGDYVTKPDVRVAKNYLGEKESQVLNLLVSQFLDYAELQALEGRTMTMKNWVSELDRQIVSNRRELLQGKGKVSHKEAVEKAEAEFVTYRAREMKELVSDFDKAVKTIGKPAKN